MSGPDRLMNGMRLGFLGTESKDNSEQKTQNLIRLFTTKERNRQTEDL